MNLPGLLDWLPAYRWMAIRSISGHCVAASMKVQSCEMSPPIPPVAIWILLLAPRTLRNFLARPQSQFFWSLFLQTERSGDMGSFYVFPTVSIARWMRTRRRRDRTYLEVKCHDCVAPALPYLAGVGSLVVENMVDSTIVGLDGILRGIESGLAELGVHVPVYISDRISLL